MAVGVGSALMVAASWVPLLAAIPADRRGASHPPWHGAVTGNGLLATDSIGHPVLIVVTAMLLGGLVRPAPPKYLANVMTNQPGTESEEARHEAAAHARRARGPRPRRLREEACFVEEWEKRIFGIHAAMMGLVTHCGSALPDYTSIDGHGLPHDVDVGRPAQGRRGDEPVRLLQVSLLREVARRHQRVLRRQGLRDPGRTRRGHRPDRPSAGSRSAAERNRRSGDSVSARGGFSPTAAPAHTEVRGRRPGRHRQSATR